MITFKQFLTEEKNELSLEEAASIIKSRCQKYLKLKIHLYRGIKESMGAFEGEVRKNRIPKDTSQTGHAILNEFFKKAFGVAARSESLFVTPSRGIASGYGVAYEIFPLDDFDYIWSPILQDAYYLESKIPNPADTRGPAAKRLGVLLVGVIRKLWPASKPFLDNKLIDLVYHGEFDTPADERLKLPKLFKNDSQSKKDRDLILKTLLELHGDELYKFNAGISTNRENEVMLVCDHYIAVSEQMAASVEFEELLRGA